MAERPAAQATGSGVGRPVFSGRFGVVVEPTGPAPGPTPWCRSSPRCGPRPTSRPRWSTGGAGARVRTRKVINMNRTWTKHEHNVNVR